MGQNLVKELIQFGAPLTEKDVAALWSQYSVDGVLGVDRWKKFTKDWAAAFNHDYEKKTKPEAQAFLQTQGVDIKAPGFFIPYRLFRMYMLQNTTGSSMEHHAVRRNTRYDGKTHGFLADTMLHESPALPRALALQTELLDGYQQLPLSDEKSAQLLTGEPAVSIWEELEYIPQGLIHLHEQPRSNFDVESATLNQIVALMLVKTPTAQLIAQNEYTAMVLWVYRGFAEPETLFDKLTELWKGPADGASRPDMIRVRKRLMQVFRHWLVSHPADLTASQHRALGSALRLAGSAPQLQREHALLRTLLQQKRQSSMPMDAMSASSAAAASSSFAAGSPSSSPSSSLPVASASSSSPPSPAATTPLPAVDWSTVPLHSVNIKVVAEQLTVRAFQSFTAIDRSEFGAWIADDYSRASHLAFFNARVPVLHNKMTTGLLAAGTNAARVVLLTRAIDLGLELFQLNNICDGFAVAMTLHSEDIKRLTAAVDGLSAKHRMALDSLGRHYERAQDPAAFTDWQFSLPRPCVFYLEPFRQLLTAKLQNQQRPIMPHLIPFWVHSSIYEMFFPVSQAMHHRYPFPTDPKFGQLLQRLKTATPEENRRISLELLKK